MNARTALAGLVALAGLGFIAWSLFCDATPPAGQANRSVFFEGEWARPSDLENLEVRIAALEQQLRLDTAKPVASRVIEEQPELDYETLVEFLTPRLTEQLALRSPIKIDEVETAPVSELAQFLFGRF